MSAREKQRHMAAATKSRAVAWYAGATAALILGTLLAARAYPEGFDWMYTVVSAIASQKHNPDGARWFAGSLVVAMALLWPAVRRLWAERPPKDRAANYGAAAIQLGTACGCLLGLERLIIFHLSDVVRKGHELLSLVAYLALFTGVLALYRSRSRNDPAFRWAAWTMGGPLIAIGISQFALYLDQRDLGWVDGGWREMGIPVWYSFAFWQWLAVSMLWLAIGHLVVTARRTVNKQPIGA